MAKADKATAVAEITEQFKSSTATVVTEYRGPSVANLAELRRPSSGTATYTVAKNTLVKRAAADAGIDGPTICSPDRPRDRVRHRRGGRRGQGDQKFAKDHKALLSGRLHGRSRADRR